MPDDCVRHSKQSLEELDSLLQRHGSNWDVGLTRCGKKGGGACRAVDLFWWSSKPSHQSNRSSVELDCSALGQDWLDVLCQGLHVFRVRGIDLEVRLHHIHQRKWLL